jgi:galacturan 1,4-alpha-galacturonidase
MDYCTSNGDESLTIKNIEFSKIIGSASSKGNPVVNLNCSTSTPCEGIKLSKINITPASNSKPNVCENVIGSESIAECQ